MTQRRIGVRAAAAVAVLLASSLWTPVVTAAGGGSTRASDHATTPLSAVAAPPSVQETVADAPSDSGEWGPLLDWGVQAKHMIQLSTGKVLVWSTGDNARVWDPTTGTFTLAPATFADLHCAGQATLADGRVIVVGGQVGSPHNGHNITSLFDPITQTWMRGADMTDLRWYATATTLANGEVLASSGDAPDGTRSTIPEVYDPVSNTWRRLTTASRDQGLYPFMFVLPNGKPYEAGSRTDTAILDPSGTGHWTPGPTGLWSTSGYSESQAMYRPGKILRAGGGDPAIARAAVIDMNAASPAWREIDPMANARRRMNMIILADGTVLAIGGTASADNEAAAVLATEIWNPDTEKWTTGSSMAEARMYHSSAVLLPDGRVVVGGGEAAGRLRSQIYSPPYLFKGARPTISGSPGTAAWGSTFTFTSPNAADLVSVVLMRPSGSTHAIDMNQRYVPLTYSRSGTTITATAPASGGMAPPGDYMLIVKNSAGVPSVASWIRIGSSANIQPGSISGSITDSGTAAPIGGATVSSGGRSTTTNASGAYTLTNVAAGEAQVTIAASGYATEVRQAVVTGGQTTSLDVAMSRPGDISGVVTNSGTGAALAGVTVGYPGGVTVTDSTGHYAINGLPAGSHDLTFAATGFVSADRTATVTAGSVTTLDVQLAPTATWVTGEVRDAVSTAILPGATVSVDTGQTATTNSQGRYRIDLPPGTYQVTAAAAGYVSSTGTAVINGGSYASLDFNLARTPSPGTTLTFTTTAEFDREVVEPDEELRQGHRGQAASRHAVELDGPVELPPIRRIRAGRTRRHEREAAAARHRRRTPRRDPLPDGEHLDRDRIDVQQRSGRLRQSALYRRGGDRRAMGRPATPRRHDHGRRQHRLRVDAERIEQRLLLESRRRRCAATRRGRRRRGDADTYADAHAHPDADTDGDAQRNADGHAHRDPDLDTDGDAHRDADIDTDGDAHRDPDGHADPDPDAAAGRWFERAPDHVRRWPARSDDRRGFRDRRGDAGHRQPDPRDSVRPVREYHRISPGNVPGDRGHLPDDAGATRGAADGFASDRLPVECRDHGREPHAELGWAAAAAQRVDRCRRRVGRHAGGEHLPHRAASGSGHRHRCGTRGVPRARWRDVRRTVRSDDQRDVDDVGGPDPIRGHQWHGDRRDDR